MLQAQQTARPQPREASEDASGPAAAGGEDESGPAAGVRLVAEYDVPGARWAPSYTLRFDEALEQATLQVRAQVAQASGEDWQGVAIRLSTAQPEQWAELPELQSRRIGRKQAQPARSWLARSPQPAPRRSIPTSITRAGASSRLSR